MELKRSLLVLVTTSHGVHQGRVECNMSRDGNITNIFYPSI